MRLVVFTRSAEDLDATWLRLLHERAGVAAVLVCHEARRALSRPADGGHPAGGRAARVDGIDVEWLWCRTSGGDALDSRIRAWGPDLALALDEPPTPVPAGAPFP